MGFFFFFLRLPPPDAKLFQRLWRLACSASFFFDLNFDFRALAALCFLSFCAAESDSSGEMSDVYANVTGSMIVAELEKRKRFPDQ